MSPVAIITGSATGVGAARVARLAAKGWTVLARARRPEDSDRLVADVAGDVRPLLLDVTDTSMVKQAASMVKTVCKQRGLRGLVNNAGVPLIRSVELVSVEQWREGLEVNLARCGRHDPAVFEHVRVGGGRLDTSAHSRAASGSQEIRPTQQASTASRRSPKRYETNPKAPRCGSR
jgi:NAD(P)-dependent dehydrogenase (short-subunit alcohol dehydrogenase family)